VLLILLGGMVLVFAVGIGWSLTRLSRIQSEKRQAIAEATADTPNWKLIELENSRDIVPDDRNSARTVVRVFDALPPGWLEPVKGKRAAATASDGPPRGAILYDRLTDSSKPTAALPNLRLVAEDLAGLRAEIASLQPALSAAEPLADGVQEGRYPITYATNVLETDLAHVQNTRTITRLLQLDAILHAEEGEPDAALEDCRRIFNVGRSIGDEPTAISQLVRIAIGGVAIKTLERSLAQGEPSDQALVLVNDALLAELSTPRLLTALRGERAFAFDLIERIRNGQLSTKALTGEVADSSPPRTSPPVRIFCDHNEGLSLKFMNQAVAIAKSSPIENRQKLFEEWSESMLPHSVIDRQLGMLSYMLLPGLSGLNDAETRYQSALECSRVLVALERFRRKNGRWPGSLDALVPAFLPSLPTDPYDGKPIRMAPAIADGLVVYSVGPDLNDDGGNIDPTFRIKMGRDFGYRLWNVDARRQPAPEMPLQLPGDVFESDGP
jgi:hypothetical protein